MVQASMCQPPAHFRFFDLPAEIQLQICEYATVRSEPIAVITTVSSSVRAKIARIYYGVVDDNDEISQAIAKVPIWDKKVRKKRLASITPPTLAHVCRQTRADVLRLFYSRNKFIACPTSRHWEKQLLQWLRHLGGNRRHLKELSFYDIDAVSSNRGSRMSTRISDLVYDRRLQRMSPNISLLRDQKGRMVHTLSFQ
ncbi:hypothetical protein K431DRAFT_298132 [Polychaeton citri CBS 116435]|uniref:2EXR domain-containing protein n=1 Tax=Polychaeton citri CBS 116435 TaxID=1314669 RepID=A0A9P4Q070_9PEZI|nr:hypothetical protein K431DRAFT_298132 [Polychaeton citri CBS 116435]